MQCLMEIPFVNLTEQHAPLKERLLNAVGEVIDDGKFILGKKIDEFERKFAELCGVKYAIGVASGTDALFFSLKALDIGEGDEVITVANSFITTVSAIVCTGAKPVFVDVGDDYNIDTSLIEEAVTSKTKAILPVHLTGRPANMDRIREISEKHDLYVIEDCAQAVGAELNGKKVGNHGDVGCFSLHPLKTLNACGDGGVITTNDEQIYNTLSVLRESGCSAYSNCIMWSNHSRLDTLQAAMLLVKLDYLKEWTDKRRTNAEFYRQKLADVNQVELPKDDNNKRCVYHTFVIQAQKRDELQYFLEESGIGTKIHYPVPIHLQPVAKDLGYKKGRLPVTERQTKTILSLPIYPELTMEQLDYVVGNIWEFYKLNGKV